MNSNGGKQPAATRRAVLPVPPGFSFERTVLSHGWFDLPPFAWDGAASSLRRTLRLPDAGPALATIRVRRGNGGPAAVALDLSAHRPLTRADRNRAARDVLHMLRLDEELAEFYRKAGGVSTPDLRWAGPAGAGRLLRAPSVFEDLVRMICTTNCTWALTKVMVTALVERLGEPAPGGSRAFPTPDAMAARPPRFYRDTVRAGYRAAYLRHLAREVARGSLNPEAWLDPALASTEVRRQILSVPGAGPYVADHLMRLLGRYDGLGIDSWCRRKFSTMYHGGRAVADRRIERFYAPFGPWRGLAFWCDLTKDWFAEDGTGNITTW